MILVEGIREQGGTLLHSLTLLAARLPVAVALGRSGNGWQSFLHTFASGSCHSVSLLRSLVERG